MTRVSVVLLIPLVLLLAACASQGEGVAGTPAPPTATIRATNPAPIVEPTKTVEPTPTVKPTLIATAMPLSPQVSFKAATYRDKSAGFEFDYPSSWVLPDQTWQGDRGSVVQLTASGKPRLDITVLRWDPTNNLQAFVDRRKLGWAETKFSILSEETITLAGDRKAVLFVVQSSVGEQGFFFFTTVGERYLQLSGDGDLKLLAEICRTVRPLVSGS